MSTPTPHAAAAKPRRVLIILNPAAGRSRLSRRQLGRVIAALERRGCTVVLRCAGAAIGDAERLAHQAEANFDVIVAAGGDGTVNAVINGLDGVRRPIAVLPFGTANVLAREVGLPRRAEDIAALIAGGAARDAWPGRVGERLFLTMASAGFDAEIVAAVDLRMKRYAGRLAFAWAILLRLYRYRAHQLIVTVGGTEYRAAGIIATKGRHYAGPFIIAPGANLAEPMLDVLLLPDSGRIGVLTRLLALLLGRAARMRGVTRLRCRAATVAAAAPLPVQADGEIVGRLPVSIAVAERPLQLVQP